MCILFCSDNSFVLYKYYRAILSHYTLQNHLTGIVMVEWYLSSIKVIIHTYVWYFLGMNLSLNVKSGDVEDL